MPLYANARLGPYEIRSTLGAGGMGEVYQAFDSRLNRSVETIAAIVREEPLLLDEKLPAPLRWIIDRCLQKE